MIYELTKDQYPFAQKLFMGKECSIEPQGVLELNNPGWVFADDPIMPKTVLIWAQGIEGFYLAGDENNSHFIPYLNELVDEIIVPRLKNMGFDWFEVSGIHSKWNGTIEEIFKKRSLTKWKQCVLFYEKKAEPFPDLQQSEAFKVYKIEEETLKLVHLRNLNFLTSHIKKFWGSEENFLKIGIGYYAVNQSEILGLCCSGSASYHYHTIDIITNEKYRNKGIGTACTKMIIKEYITKGITPYWECEKENKASFHLAQKCGFTKKYEYSCYGFPLDNS